MTVAPKEEEKSTKAAEEATIDMPKPVTPKVNEAIPLLDQFKALKDDQKQRVVNYTMESALGKFSNFRYAYHGYAIDNPNNKGSNYSK